MGSCRVRLRVDMSVYETDVTFMHVRERTRKDPRYEQSWIYIF